VRAGVGRQRPAFVVFNGFFFLKIWIDATLLFIAILRPMTHGQAVKEVPPPKGCCTRPRLAWRRDASRRISGCGYWSGCCGLLSVAHISRVE
jgi:hypothetical protein